MDNLWPQIAQKQAFFSCVCLLHSLKCWLEKRDKSYLVGIILGLSLAEWGVQGPLVHSGHNFGLGAEDLGPGGRLQHIVHHLNYLIIQR